MPSALAVFACRPNSHPFQERHVYLDEPVKIGRSVARCRPAQNNATFDCKVLSRNHALVWFDHKTGKVRQDDCDGFIAITWVSLQDKLSCRFSNALGRNLPECSRLQTSTWSSTWYHSEASFLPSVNSTPTWTDSTCAFTICIFRWNCQTLCECCLLETYLTLYLESSTQSQLRTGNVNKTQGTMGTDAVPQAGEAEREQISSGFMLYLCFLEVVWSKSSATNEPHTVQVSYLFKCCVNEWNTTTTWFFLTMLM